MILSVLLEVLRLDKHRPDDHFTLFRIVNKTKCVLTTLKIVVYITMYKTPLHTSQRTQCVFIIKKNRLKLLGK
jgi:hypothetical protein